MPQLIKQQVPVSHLEGKVEIEKGITVGDTDSLCLKDVTLLSLVVFSKTVVNCIFRQH